MHTPLLLLLLATAGQAPAANAEAVPGEAESSPAGVGDAPEPTLTAPEVFGQVPPDREPAPSTGDPRPADPLGVADAVTPYLGAISAAGAVSLVYLAWEMTTPLRTIASCIPGVSLLVLAANIAWPFAAAGVGWYAGSLVSGKRVALLTAVLAGGASHLVSDLCCATPLTFLALVPVVGAPVLLLLTPIILLPVVLNAGVTAAVLHYTGRPLEPGEQVSKFDLFTVPPPWDKQDTTKARPAKRPSRANVLEDDD